MISYRKFWDYIEKTGITQYQLIKIYSIPTSTLAKLRKNAILQTVTIAKICDALGCQPGDIMENIPAEEVQKKNLVGKKVAGNHLISKKQKVLFSTFGDVIT